MKRLFLLLAMLVTLSGQAIAKKETISTLEMYQKGDPEKNTSRIRMPIQLPLSVSFDDETRTIEATTPDDNIIGQVYVFDEKGQIVGYAPSLNSVIDIPPTYQGLLFIRIDGTYWIANCSICV